MSFFVSLASSKKYVLAACQRKKKTVACRYKIFGGNWHAARVYTANWHGARNF
jgi:hypothetical protein